MKLLNTLAAFAVLSVATMTVGAGFSTRVEDSPGAGHGKHMDACAKVCGNCQIQCDSCYKYCLTQLTDGKKEHAKSTQLCVDCSECCKLCATLCARHSSFCPAACECCAKCCDGCAAACEQSADSAEMKACAAACKKCAASCLDMVKMVAQK